MDKVLDTGSLQVVHASRSTGYDKHGTAIQSLKAGTAYSAYSSSLEHNTTMSALAAIAASIPSSTVGKPRLSTTSYPAQARKLQEYCARAWRMARYR